MKKLDPRVNIKRNEFQKSLPQIQLDTCRVEKSDDSKVRRIIIEGNPVLLDAILPRAEIGGLKPLKLMASADRKIAAGLIRGELKSKYAILDYGFTRDECQLDEVVFTPIDMEIFEQTTLIPLRKAPSNQIFRTITNILAGLLWQIKKRLS